MKKHASITFYFTLAITVACVISCNEQDEVQSNAGNLNSNSAPASPKNRNASGRIGGEIFNSSVGGALSLETAQEWMANYQSKNAGDTKGHFFGTEIIQQILNEEGCVGIRIYYAADENGDKKLLLMGVDGSGKDLLPGSGDAPDNGYTIGDFSYPCPSYCQ